MKKQFKDVIVVGFALFAMFLGAGNLIFPPTLGHVAGSHWPATMLGFMTTGIGLPVLGILATAKAGGKMRDIAHPLGNGAANLLGFLIMLTIGPLLAIPRTAAVTFALGIQPVLPDASPAISSILFFGLVLFFTLNPSSVVDKVGKFLTPILLIILGAIIVAGVFFPMGSPVATEAGNHYFRGFEGGYQTMDALGSVILASIVIQSIAARGYAGASRFRMTVYAGVIAAIGLALVYCSLIFIGATGSGIFSSELNRVELLMALIHRLFGPYGKAALGMAVSLACLTTAIGLTATSGDFFSDLFPGVRYKSVVVVTCLFSAFFAISGVDAIINFSVPILSVLYPVTIVLIILTLILPKGKFYPAYRGAAFGALVMSLIQTIVQSEDAINAVLQKLSVSMFSSVTPQSVNFETVIATIEKIPLSKEGFVWVIPALACGLLYQVICSLRASRKTAA